MLFDFFKSKRQTEIENDDDELISSSICYFMKSDGSGPYIDIQISDYNDDTVATLCELLDTLAKESCYIETINMIKSAMVEDGREDILLKIFTHISNQVKTKILKDSYNSLKDEPCIRPSDMV